MRLGELPASGFCDAGLISSSQVNIFLNFQCSNYEGNEVHRKAITTLIAVFCCSIANHWHDSQVGSSTPQNLMSVAGTASICARAAAAAASNALMPPDDALGAPPEVTALCEPLCTVDFSTCVALVVRK